MDAYLSVSEMRSEMGIGQNAAYALVHKPGFPAVRIGRRIVIPRDLLRAWLVKEAGA